MATQPDAGDTHKVSASGELLYQRSDVALCRRCGWGRTSGRCSCPRA
jgi:hypothetical protein